MVKIKLWIIFFMLISINGISQNNQNINQVDEQGKKHGMWIKKYPGGQTRYKGRFNHGTPTGTFKRYFRNGELMAIMQHRNDSAVYATLYNEKGKKRAEGKYINKEKDSTWVFYDPEGNVILQEKFNMGVRNGKSVRFYPNGDTSQVVVYKNGIKNGIFKQYFSNGNLKLLARYQKNELDGYVTIFAPNGHKEVEGLYRDNLRQGKWVYYKGVNDTAQVLRYKDGEPLNEDSLELQESKEIIRLENNEGKFGDPRQELMPGRRRQQR